MSGRRTRRTLRTLHQPHIDTTTIATGDGEPISHGFQARLGKPYPPRSPKSEIGVADPGTSHSAEMPLMGWMSMSP
jgi:hypothetical protein